MRFRVNIPRLLWNVLFLSCTVPSDPSVPRGMKLRHRFGDSFLVMLATVLHPRTLINIPSG